MRQNRDFGWSVIACLVGLSWLYMRLYVRKENLFRPQPIPNQVTLSFDRSSGEGILREISKKFEGWNLELLTSGKDGKSTIQGGAPNP